MSYKFMSDALYNNLMPIGKSDFLNLFKDLEIGEGDILIAHVSLSKFGYIIGGARCIYEALMERLGKSGTLVVPTQSLENMSPEYWEYPKVPKEWIEKIKQESLSYDVDLSSTRGMGKFSEFVMNLKHSVRSSHPLYSFSAVGEKAQEIIEEHPLDDGLGYNSPLGRLYDQNAKILLLGTDFESNTALHLAEYSLNRKTIKESANVDGEWLEFSNIELDIYDDFLTVQKEFMENCKGSYQIKEIQKTSVFCIDLKSCVDFAKEYYKKKEEINS